MNQLLLEYMRTHDIEDKMVYKKAAIQQMCFVRDALCQYLLQVPVFVVSTHCSKSIQLPVYYFEMRNGIRAIMRENFHGWVVSLNSSFPITLEDFCEGDGNKQSEDIHPCYAEGFKKSWVYPYVKEEALRTTFRVNSKYQLYTLFYLLSKMPKKGKRAIINVDEENQARMMMQEVIKDHPEMSAWELFSCSIFKAEHVDGHYNHISIDNELRDLPKWVGKSNEVAEEFSVECALLYKGGLFE